MSFPGEGGSRRTSPRRCLRGGRSRPPAPNGKGRQKPSPPRLDAAFPWAGKDPPAKWPCPPPPPPGTRTFEICRFQEQPTSHANLAENKPSRPCGRSEATASGPESSGGRARGLLRSAPCEKKGQALRGNAAHPATAPGASAAWAAMPGGGEPAAPPIGRARNRLGLPPGLLRWAFAGGWSREPSLQKQEE